MNILHSDNNTNYNIFAIHYLIFFSILFDFTVLFVGLCICCIMSQIRNKTDKSYIDDDDDKDDNTTNTNKSSKINFKFIKYENLYEKDCTNIKTLIDENNKDKNKNKDQY